jgi:4-diphosphocytidyl-2-C-methyl-D-erythritol kinase
MSEVLIKSPAKINLYLQILDKRDDGYHNIKTHLQLIDIYDHIKFKTSKNKNIYIKSKESYLNNEDNTIYNAAKKLQKYQKCNSFNGVEIEIEKNIPIGSGLGGASSNAASTLIVLNKLWNLNLSEDKLMKIGATIGADVPFFVYGKNAFGEGIGEKLKEVDMIPDKILILNPNIHCSTKKMFSLYDKFLKNNKNISLSNQNHFWNIYLDKNPNIKNFITNNQLEEKINLSGSGSCMFIKYKNKKDIDKIIEKMPSNWRLFFSKPLQYSPICYIK